VGSNAKLPASRKLWKPSRSDGPFAPYSNEETMGSRTRALLLAATVIVAAGCSQAPQRQGPPPLAVTVAKANRQDIATLLTLDGQITPRQQSQLALQQSGTVLRVDVVQGQRVHAGDELAKLDDSTLRANLANAVAQISSGQAAYSKTNLLNGANTQQYQQAVAQDKNAVENATAQLNNAALVYKQNTQLFPQGFVSQTTLEQSRANNVAAQQTLASAKAKLQQDTAALSNIPAYSQTIVGAKATLDQARAQADLYRTEIAQTTLFAPYDGVITARMLDPGAYAAPNQPILTISQVDPVYVNVNVPDDDLAFVRARAHVKFSTSTNPNRLYDATVNSINATPTQGTLSYQAQIIMPNSDFSLRGGQLVSVTVRKEYHRNAIVVPRSAVFVGDRGSNVFTVVAGAAGAPPTAHAVPVQVGLQTDTLSEVISPEVRSGTQVIVTRPDALQDKSVLAVAPPQGAQGGSGSAQAGNSTK
jgi:HlyD family secretion protein